MRSLADTKIGPCHWSFGFAVLALVGVLATPVYAIGVRCDRPAGDAAGWTIATGGDFDGDGIVDIAVGAPCSIVRGNKKVGRAMVFSGVDGSRLLVLKGTQAFERLGSAVGFVPDVDGDGKDELVVGSSGWPVIDSGGKLRPSAGKVGVYSVASGLLFSREGQFGNGNLGEAVVGLSDVTGDGRGDLVVGAGNDRVSGERRGIAYLISGADGTVVDQSLGAVKFDGWGSVLADPGDVDGDGTADVIVASGSAEVPPAAIVAETNAWSRSLVGLVFQESPPVSAAVVDTDLNNGAVQVLSGQDLTTILAVVYGQPESKLGRSVAPAGNLGFLAGAPGQDVAGKNKAGSVFLYSWGGKLLRSFQEPTPQVGAALGSAVAAMGDVNGDGSVDLVAGAPVGGDGDFSNLGRVRAFSGETGSLLWSLAGTLPGERLGQSLGSGADYNGDGVDDVLIGAPGDAPHGRRGAGTVRVVSGADGSELFRLRGRRGLETRVFVLGRDGGQRAQLAELNYRGRRVRRGFRGWRSIGEGEFSISVMDEHADPLPGDMKVVVTSGRGGNDLVTVRTAGRRGRLISTFRGMDGMYAGGVTVAVGDVLGDGQDDIVTAQADFSDGTIVVKVFGRFDLDPTSGLLRWLEQAAFTPFLPTDMIAGRLIDAHGANVAVGRGGALGGVLIFVAPNEGVPIVRAIDTNGLVQVEWVAYFPTDNDGVTLAIGDLDGDGQKELVTIPVFGLPVVKAFTFDGLPFVPRGESSPVSFTLTDSEFSSGATLTVADVDLDGRGEILVASGTGHRGLVRAYESDGTLVSSWRAVRPYGPVTGGLAIAATDRFIRQ